MELPFIRAGQENTEEEKVMENWVLGSNHIQVIRVKAWQKPGLVKF